MHRAVTLEGWQNRGMSTITLTRKELYEKVWTTPMARLAAEFGISDVALAKKCRRMNVPRPGRGYWARVAAGEKLKRAPLPKEGIRSDEIALLRRVENPVRRSSGPTPPTIEVGTTLNDASDVVVRLAKMLQRAPTDECGRLLVGNTTAPVLAVSVVVHRRVLLIVDALCKALMVRGHATRLLRARNDVNAESPSTRLVATVNKCELEITVAEIIERRERPRTEREEQRAAFRPQLFDRASPPLPREPFASGRIQISVGGLHSWRSSWSDGKLPVERRLGSIIAAAESESGRREEYRERRERERAEHEERQRLEAVAAEKRRLEEEARRTKQAEIDARTTYRAMLEKDVLRMAREWDRANTIRKFLEAVEVEIPICDRGEEFKDWLQWATDFATELDPIGSPHLIAKTVTPDADQLAAVVGDRGE